MTCLVTAAQSTLWISMKICNKYEIAWRKKQKFEKLYHWSSDQSWKGRSLFPGHKLAQELMHNFLHVTNTIGKALNEGKFCIGLFLDLRKAFDVCCVPTRSSSWNLKTWCYWHSPKMVQKLLKGTVSRELFSNWDFRVME